MKNSWSDRATTEEKKKLSKHFLWAICSTELVTCLQIFILTTLHFRSCLQLQSKMKPPLQRNLTRKHKKSLFEKHHQRDFQTFGDNERCKQTEKTCRAIKSSFKTLIEVLARWFSFTCTWKIEFSREMNFNLSWCWQDSVSCAYS